MRRWLFSLVAVALLAAPSAWARGDPQVAGLQVALERRHAYSGTIDGEYSRATEQAVRAFQARAGLGIDGVAGSATLRALGPFAAHRYGSRLLGPGARGVDVAALQFALAWAGFPSGNFDGRFGPQVAGALRRFQSQRDLPVTGLAGPRTRTALATPPPDPPFLLAWPLLAPVGDRFGPRGDRFHAGIDLPAPYGVPVAAAAAGRVAFAGDRDGFGRLVTIAHGNGVRTLYAHLARITVRVGEVVAAGTPVGNVGASGDATGPHLHFEVRVDGGAVDPLPHLVALP